MQYSGTPQRAHRPTHRPTHHVAAVGGEIPPGERARSVGGASDPLPKRAKAAAAGTLARAAIRFGVSLFPCDAAKRPLTRRGFHDASSDPATIGRMSTQRAAWMIGMPTEPAFGLIVVDIDIKDGARGMEWFERHRGEIPPMHVHWTASREAPR